MNKIIFDSPDTPNSETLYYQHLPAFHMFAGIFGLCVGFGAYFSQQISLPKCTQCANKAERIIKHTMQQFTIYKQCHKVKIKEIIAQQKLPSADELVFAFIFPSLAPVIAGM